MTFQEVKAIMKQEGISEYSYDILGTGRVKGYDGFVIAKSKKGYDLYYMERGEKTFLAWFSDEHEASVAFLKEFIRSGDPQLEKYIQ